MGRTRIIGITSLALGIFLIGSTLALASDINTAVLDTSAPTGSVSLEAGQQGTVQFTFSVTGNQVRTCSVSYLKDWTLSGGSFTGANAGTFSVGPQSPGTTTTYGPFSGTVSVAGGQATGAFTLAIKPTIGTCTGTGASLSLGTASSYAVTVVPPADSTPPVITPNVSGSLGSHGWYVGDVAVSWSVADGESAVSSTTGCDPISITTDTNGTTLTCSATSAGGTASSSVTIKRDATAPTMTASLDPAANGAGWNDSDVVVSYACDDAGGSGIDPNYGCPGDDELTVNGLYELHKATADMAGNTITPSFTVRIDQEDPTIVGSALPAPNENGWRNAAVTVHFECFDGLSGLASCTADSLLSSEGADQSVGGTATDVAGNETTTTVGDIDIDLTAPGISFVGPLPTGWSNAPVELTWTCSDALSGPASPTVSQTLGEGAGQSATGTCVDLADNEASDTQSGYDVDLTPPTIAFESRTEPNEHGWNAGPVSVTWTCTDELSGVVDDSVMDVVATDGAGQTASGTCEDLAGNTASATLGDIDIDTSAPVITDEGPSSPPDGANGWYVTAVTNGFSADGAISGLADPADASFSVSSGTAEGAAIVIPSGAVSDRAGNTNPGIDSAAFAIDLSDPTDVAFSAGGPDAGGSYVFGSVPAAPTCSATDAVSGLAGCAVTGYSTAVGPHTMTATATDVAGRTASIDRSYSVLAWTLRGFTAPVDMGGTWNIVKNGATVPLKFEVFAGGTELTDASAVAGFAVKGVACPGASAVTDDIELTTTGGTSLRYDAVAGQFVQNWQTPKKPGACYAVTMTTLDGSAITANVRLK